MAKCDTDLPTKCAFFGEDLPTKCAFFFSRTVRAQHRYGLNFNLKPSRVPEIPSGPWHTDPSMA